MEAGAPLTCTLCGHANAAGVRVCAACTSPLTTRAGPAPAPPPKSPTLAGPAPGPSKLAPSKPTPAKSAAPPTSPPSPEFRPFDALPTAARPAARPLEPLPVDPLAGSNPFIPHPGALEEAAEARPAALTAEIVQLYRGGRRFRAHQKLRAIRDRDPIVAPTRNRLVDDLRLWAEPCEAPPLTTVNTVGTRVYGRHDARPDGTYVTTLYVVAAFLPLFPIASYLVGDGNGGWRASWYFLARVPMPPGARTMRLVVTGLLLAGLVVAACAGLGSKLTG